MRFALYAAVLGLWCLGTALSVLAADGDFDTSFGTGGAVHVPHTGSDLSSGLALQPDGKILLVDIDTGGLEIARFDTAGMLDATFGVGGVVTQPAPGGSIHKLLRLPDGKLLMLVSSSPTFVLARYDASGTPDASFGTGGIASLPDCGIEFVFADLAVQADGKSVVAISRYDPDANEYHACVVRVDASGAPDPGFGVGGVVALPNWYGAAIALQDDDVLVGGAVTEPFATAVMRLSASGAVASGFGDDGVFTATLSPSPGPVFDLAVQADGSILALGNELQLLRVHENGKLDGSFGTGGVATAPPPPDGIFADAQAMAVQGDGKIVVGATYTEFNPPISSAWVELFRFDVDGTLDASFGSGGMAPSVNGVLGDLVLQPDGKTLISAGHVPNFIFPTGPITVARHDFTLGCPASAALGCRTAVVPAGGKLRMDATTSSKAKFQWSWQKGAATTLGDFGDPIGGDDYTLCLYDESSGSTLTRGAVVPGGGTCKGKPCWKALGTSGFAYKDSKRVRYGIAAIKLKAGVDGKAQLKIQGQGTTLPVPALPAPLPLRLQLIAENGQCWESVFSTTGLTRNDAGRFQGKSD